MDLKWLEVIKAVLPLALAASGNEKAAQIGSLAIAGVESAEALAQGTGTQKLQYALHLTDIGLQGYNVARPDHPIQIEDVHNAVVQGINTAIAVANLFKNVTPPVTLVNG